MIREERLKACSRAGVMMTGETMLSVINGMGFYAQYTILITKFGLPRADQIKPKGFYPLVSIINAMYSPLVNASIKRMMGRRLSMKSSIFYDVPRTINDVMLTENFNTIYNSVCCMSDGSPITNAEETIGTFSITDSEDNKSWLITSTSVFPTDFIEGYLQGVGFRIIDNKIPIKHVRSNQIDAMYQMTKPF